MNKGNFKYLSVIPHTNNSISLPLLGLFIAVSDLVRFYPNLPSKNFVDSKFNLEKKYSDACNRISDCISYLSTITSRLFVDQPGVLKNQRLDYENFIVYIQIALDSLAILIPFFYSSDGSFIKIVNCSKCNSDIGLPRKVNGFSDLELWFTQKLNDDELHKKYVDITNDWYKQINNDRDGLIHRHWKPYPIKKAMIESMGFQLDKDRIMMIRDTKEGAWIDTEIIEDKVTMTLKNLLDFLGFCHFFFEDRLSKQGISLGDTTNMYILELDGEIFNRLVFEEINHNK